MSAAATTAANSPPQPDDWDAVDDVQDVVPGYNHNSFVPSSTATAQAAARIEYELEARRKFEEKQFPHRVDATGDDNEDSSSSSDETGIETVPTSNLGTGRGGEGEMKEEQIFMAPEDNDPPPVVVNVLQPTVEEVDEEEEETEPTTMKAPPAAAAAASLWKLHVETVRMDGAELEEEEQEQDHISPLANNSNSNNYNGTFSTVNKETIAQQQNFRSASSAASHQPPPSSSSRFHFSGASYPQSLSNSTGALTVATSKEPSPVDSRFGGSSPAPSLNLSPPMARLQFSPLALPPPNSDGFAQVLKERTRQRRAQEDAAVSSLRAQVQRLEAALAMESKRRVASIRSLHEQSMQAAQELQERLKLQMVDEIGLVNNRLERLEERMTVLESRYDVDLTQLQTQMTLDATTIQSQLHDLTVQFTNEEQQRKIRHSQQLEQIQSVSDEYRDKWQTERHERLTDTHQLHTTMDQFHIHREQNMASYEGQLTYELQQLSQDLSHETSERQGRDHEIVNALNNYVQQLQDSLAAAVTRGSVY
jgi:SF-assemblin/beta giardin